MSKHTPGPWQVNTPPAPLGVETAAGVLIADVEPYPRDDDEAEAEANARLIAAAPCLLTACEAAAALLRRLGGHNHDPEYAELLAALARARPVDPDAPTPPHPLRGKP